MDSPQSKEKSRSGEGGYYGYSGSYGDYGSVGYGGGSETTAQRTFQDYLLILRERVWYIVVVFLVIFSSVVVFTLSQTKLYQATASVQIFRREAVVMQVQSVTDTEIKSSEDLNTQVKVLESAAIVQQVASRLTGEDLRQFLAPYEKSNQKTGVSPVRIILGNRKISPFRLSLVVAVEYTHPDPAVAAKIANLFVDEYINYNSRMRIEDSMKAVDDLQVRAEEQKKKVEELGLLLQNYREKNNLVSLDQRKDIVTEKLKALNIYVTQTSAKLKDAEIRLNQVKE